MISLGIWHQWNLLKSLHPLTLTNSITRKSSVAVSISSTSMMIFGCFTLRRIDTSFSIRCSCQRKGLETWVRNHRTICLISTSWRLHSVDWMPREANQTLAKLVSTGTGQASMICHCHQQKGIDILQNVPWKGSVVLPWHIKHTAFSSLQHLKRSWCWKLGHTALCFVIQLEPFFFYLTITLKTKIKYERTFASIGNKTWALNYFVIFKPLLIWIWVSCWNLQKKFFFLYAWMWNHSPEGCSVSSCISETRKQRTTGTTVLILFLNTSLKILPDYQSWWVMHPRWAAIAKMFTHGIKELFSVYQPWIMNNHCSTLLWDMEMCQ